MEKQWRLRVVVSVVIRLNRKQPEELGYNPSFPLLPPPSPHLAPAPTDAPLPSSNLLHPIDIDSLKLLNPIDIDSLKLLHPIDIDSLKLLHPIDIDSLKLLNPLRQLCGGHGGCISEPVKMTSDPPKIEKNNESIACRSHLNIWTAASPDEEHLNQTPAQLGRLSNRFRGKTDRR
ncbi:hypothetical protein EYF80_066116 [Liparis tanakae]|uniref:Uncharacterized protein n=1 Tax=Liparis tanakae TaxID=230148 RepID=A0A4Z2E5Y7_9TELE|nr:hypothetical protein EYF80_066116 [Liparis tanakae]